MDGISFFDRAGSIVVQWCGAGYRSALTALCPFLSSQRSHCKEVSHGVVQNAMLKHLQRRLHASSSNAVVNRTGDTSTPRTANAHRFRMRNRTSTVWGQMSKTNAPAHAKTCRTAEASSNRRENASSLKGRKCRQSEHQGGLGRQSNTRLPNSTASQRRNARQNVQQFRSTHLLGSHPPLQHSHTVVSNRWDPFPIGIHPTDEPQPAASLHSRLGDHCTAEGLTRPQRKGDMRAAEHRTICSIAISAALGFMTVAVAALVRRSVPTVSFLRSLPPFLLLFFHAWLGTQLRLNIPRSTPSHGL